MPKFRRAAHRLVWLSALTGSTLAIAACGSASGGELAGVIKNTLNDPKNAPQNRANGLQSTSSVDCPAGVALKTGATFSCTAQGTDTKGKPASFTVDGHIVNGNQAEITSIQEIGAGSPSTPSTPATTTT